MRARGLVRYGVCAQSHACRRRRFLVLRRGTSRRSPLAPSRRTTQYTSGSAESGSAGPGTTRRFRVGVGRHYRTRIPLYAREWRTRYNRAPTRTAGLHGRYAPAVGLASCNTQVTARHPSTSAGQRHAQHDITPGRPPPAPGFIVRIRSLSASQALRTTIAACTSPQTTTRVHK